MKIRTLGKVAIRRRGVYPVEVQETEFFRRMADAQERVALAIEKQQPSRASQVFTMIAMIASTFGIVTIIDVIKGWFGG